MDVTQLSPTIGANIEGINLSDTLSPDVISAIKAVWDEHLVVRFRNQQSRMMIC